MRALCIMYYVLHIMYTRIVLIVSYGQSNNLLKGILKCTAKLVSFKLLIICSLEALKVSQCQLVTLSLLLEPLAEVQQ